MAKINSLDLKNWKDYPEIYTDSLWVINERDNSSSHKADYHGNFIPQIPNQLIKRFTKKGDVVLDTFLGSGTTLIECQKLDRNGIGIELNKKIIDIAKQRLDNNKNKVFSEIINGNSASKTSKDKVKTILNNNKKDKVQLILMHPPYLDIIKFSDKKADLSTASDLETFLKKFKAICKNTLDLLEDNHYLALIIGDKYEKAEWIPLGFHTMQTVLSLKNIKLKSIIVKNMTNNRAKRNLDNLWRYRALAGGFYIFKHEYIFLFQKGAKK
jgi:16S rRNA G966 N2-methylase RsmD